MSSAKGNIVEEKESQLLQNTYVSRGKSMDVQLILILTSRTLSSSSTKAMLHIASKIRN